MRLLLFAVLVLSSAATAGPDQPWLDREVGGSGYMTPILLGAAAGAGLGYLVSVCRQGREADHSGLVVLGGFAGLFLGPLLFDLL